MRRFVFKRASRSFFWTIDHCWKIQDPNRRFHNIKIKIKNNSLLHPSLGRRALLTATLAMPFARDSRITQSRTTSATTRVATTKRHARVGNLHGHATCFLPLLQNDDEFIALRTFQVRVPSPCVGGGL